MNTEKLIRAVEAFRERLGGGLLACDIWGPDGLSLASYHTQAAASALFADVTSRLRELLSTAKFPVLGRYYVLELENNQAVCVMLAGEYQWGCLVDRRHALMGKVIALAMPKALEDLRDALAA